MDLEGVWKFREETVYPKLFGSMTRGVFPLTQEIFSTFGVDDVDPRWMFLGVLEYAPTSERDSWLYVTSGYSNPWDVEPDSYSENDTSGSGVEFAIETTVSSDWAIVFLLKMLAYDLLLRAGHFEGRSSLQMHDRVPLGTAIDGKDDTSVEYVILHEPTNYSSSFVLPSGSVEFLQFIGVTEQERDFAKETSFEELRKRMEATGNFPVTNTQRD